jgi:hypothetical protein
VHADARDRTNEQQKTGGRLDQEPEQALLDGLAIADEVQNAPADPDQPQHCGGEVAEIDRTEPQRHQEGRHPFERVHVHAKHALEVRMAGRRRMLHVELATRHRHARRKEEIECDGEQRHDSAVMRHERPRILILNSSD